MDVPQRQRFSLAVKRVPLWSLREVRRFHLQQGAQEHLPDGLVLQHRLRLVLQDRTGPRVR